MALTIYSNSIHDSINTNCSIETLSSDCLFTEGPVWHPDGFYMFSDITGNCIYRIAPGNREELLVKNSGTDAPEDPNIKASQCGSNGLALLNDGTLLVCRHGSHDIAKYAGGVLTPFLQNYRDRPFNSPNDLVVHPDGTIYFSDPPYGLRDGILNPAKFQPLGGVYSYNEGELKLLCDKYQYPNGVCLSPDKTTLYICSNKPYEKFISVYDTASGNYKGIFAEENSDGIKCSRDGRVFLCNKDGIIILDKNGERMALIELPSIPANICWGGASGNDLFITARENIFLLRNLQKQKG